MRDERGGEQGARDSGSDGALQGHCFEVPLTVRVGKFFKSWGSGSLAKAGESVLSLPGGYRFEALAFRLLGRPVGRHRG